MKKTAESRRTRVRKPVLRLIFASFVATDSIEFQRVLFNAVVFDGISTDVTNYEEELHAEKVFYSESSRTETSQYFDLRPVSVV